MERDVNEIDEGIGYVGYREAFDLICANLEPVGTEEVGLEEAVGRIAASDLLAKLSYPSADVSLKDGFAVKSADVAGASVAGPVVLEVVGSVFAGSRFEGEVRRGSAVKVFSGAPVPAGAEAVVSGEFCEEVAPRQVRIRADAGPGRNILRAGGEVRAGAVIVKKGARLLPGYLGLSAASGIDRAAVYRRARVVVLGVGDEVVAPGQDLSPGQLYASNLVTMQAWLASFGIPCLAAVVQDSEPAIRRELEKYIPDVDAILTSGGAWGSERDLVVWALRGLGWREVFHHVRMGPGKGIAFGMWRGKPVFCLPGGPASNEMAFLQLALPGVLRVGGDTRHPLPTVPARLTEDLTGRHRAWTEFRDGTLRREADGSYSARLYRERSRLQAIAGANCLICIPEGVERLRSGEIVPVQLLKPLDELQSGL
jgi:molybdopterin molybdotransferase